VRVVGSDTMDFSKMELDSDGNGTADMAVLVNQQTSVWSAADFVLS
jgi:hypothetical protein